MATKPLQQPRHGDPFVDRMGAPLQWPQAWIDEVTRVVNTDQLDGSDVGFTADTAIALARSAIDMALDSIREAEAGSFRPSVQPTVDPEFAPATYADDFKETFIPTPSTPSGASGTFTTADTKTVTVENGVIISIV
jgi:hypothetical protein